ncbi:MAG: MFS transporter, partial [Alphaproteobacteria bacterium]|nr:MFS transporter [Alphaproteobacteria bacterium]
MGLIGAAFGLGFMIGPAIGGLLAGNDPLTADLETPAWVAAGLSFLALLGVALLLKESLPAERRGAAPMRGRFDAAWEVLQRPVLSRLILIFFLAILAVAGMQSVFAIWAMPQLGWGPGPVGYVFAFVGLISAVLQGGLIGRLAKRFGEERLLSCGLTLIAAGLLSLPFARDVQILAPVLTGLALGMGLMQPSLNSLISRQAGGDEQGEVMGVSQSAASLSRVLGPFAAGFCFAAFGRNSPYLAGAVLTGIALLLALKLSRGIGRMQSAQAEPLGREGGPVR